MALHSTLGGLIRDTLREYVAASELLLHSTKADGGVYGCAAATLLLCTADAIGSYHEGDNGFVVVVDGTRSTINERVESHFIVFNSRYYGLTLPGKHLSAIYRHYRCLLAHNAAIPDSAVLFLGTPDDPVITDYPGGPGTILHLAALHDRTARAVEAFLTEAGPGLDKTEQVKKIQKKGRSA